MLIRADARHLPLADATVQCCVTSPPYWGLRDYGTPGQLGLEPTPDAYVANLVTVFREVRRVLRNDGTCWVNLGDSYTQGVGTARGLPYQRHAPIKSGLWKGTRSAKRDIGNNGVIKDGTGQKPKDLVGIPWRVAFALQADGWYLRADIIWHKPNPMPESVTDRPTKAHEYLFLLTKSATYYYDAEAIKEPVSGTAHARGNGVNPKCADSGSGIKQNTSFSAAINKLVDDRNRRSVWTINTEPYPEAHFATFPEALVEPCILAGCPLGGLVLDPFIGSGTTGAVAERLGRRWVGTDLTYQQLAKARTAQRGLRFEYEQEAVNMR